LWFDTTTETIIYINITANLPLYSIHVTNVTQLQTNNICFGSVEIVV